MPAHLHRTITVFTLAVLSAACGSDGPSPVAEPTAVPPGSTTTVALPPAPSTAPQSNPPAPTAAPTVSTTAPPATPATPPAQPVDCPGEAPPIFECYTVAVPADHDDPAGATIDLAVTVNRIEAGTWTRPVLRGSGFDHRIVWSSPPNPSAAFDSVWIDRRGLGRSTPLPPCPGAEGANAQFQTGSFTDDVAAAMRDCADAALDSVPWLDTVQDDRVDALDTIAVREALGIDQWAIASTNQFTNTVLHLVDMEPERIRAIVAIGPIAGDLGGGPSDAARAFDAYAAACAATASCAAHGDIAANLAAALVRFGPGLETGTIDASGAPIVLDDVDLLIGTRAALWEPTIGAVLGTLLAGAADGSALDVIAGYFENTAYTPPPGPTAYDVISACNDTDWTDGAEADPTNPFSAVSWRDRCLVPGVLPQVVHDPPSVSTDIPVLVVVGELNSLSSGDVAREIFTGFSDIVVAVSPGIIEPVAELPDCYQGVRDAFVTDPAAPLDTTCLTRPTTQTLG